MNKDLTLSSVTAGTGRPGLLGLVPGSNGTVIFGLLVQAAQEGRAFDFLPFTTFRVMRTGAASGFSSALIFDDAFVRISDPIGTNIRSLQSGQVAKSGSLILHPGGLSIVGRAGGEHDGFLVAFDLASGMLTEVSLTQCIVCEAWTIERAASGGGQQRIMKIDVSTEV